MADALLLAFDTSGGVGSVAVARGREILASEILPERGAHARRLIPTVGELLRTAGIERRELEGIVVGLGPGSFTGVRIAAATARGLAAGLQIPVWGWSSLAAGAASHRTSIPDAGALSARAWRLPGRDARGEPELPAEADGWPRYVLLDARGDRIYGACYRILPDRMEMVVAPRGGTIHDVLAAALPSPVLFCGEGALRHAQLLEEAGHRILPLPAGLPTAPGLLRVHHLHPAAEPFPRDSRWEPTYVRSSSARPSRARSSSRGPS
ncbi:MAG: tRNA (adenosine(37)-N6)-threonylcarbamoyltransferase complex dimerization subunit type 1 TsaB [Gemmatimonadales bacterium]|nr:MAG: tRNA (adenosine(37)-N6)-threonylcarbamoyltransferase complex dimerization subunit type 1 TsaB [Gemmatimonadales bacterium]